MSDLLVTVVQIDEVLEHPQADRLEIIKLGGWQIVSGKDNYKVGDLAVHVPPDAMVPKDLADKWAVTPYLSWKKDATKGRVKCVRLRGATSFGFLAPNDTNAEVDTNLAEVLGIEKYEEPIPIGMQSGQMARQHPLFHGYTDIQNLRNYPDKPDYSKLLIVTEKLHGTNSRCGYVLTDGKLEKVIGTHRTQRKVEDCGVYGLPFEKYGKTIERVIDFIVACKQYNPIKSLIIFGEIYGAGVQDLHYGAKLEKDYRVFDIAINGIYVPWHMLAFWQDEFGLPLVPIIACGCFNFEQLIEFAQGKTTLGDIHIREGIVVRPIEESTWGKGDLDPLPKRTIFKIISDEYLLRKNGTEHH